MITPQFNKVLLFSIIIILSFSLIVILGIKKSSFFILTNNKVFLSILIISSLIILFVFTAYSEKSEKVNLEDIEEKLKKYRERRGTQFELKEYIEGAAGIYYPWLNKVEVVKEFPHPLYEIGTGVIKEIYEGEVYDIWKKVIENPGMSYEEAEVLIRRLCSIKYELLEEKFSREVDKLKVLERLSSTLEILKELTQSLYKVADMPSIYISREAQPEYYENINKIEKYKKELKSSVSRYNLDYLIEITSDDHGLRSLVFDTLNVSNSLLRLLEKYTIRDLKLNDIKKLSDYAERIEKYVHNRLKRYESLKEIRDKISEIIRFLDNDPENRKASIGRYISTAAHEHAHAIFDHLLRKYGIGLEFYEVLDSIDEGFGEAFSLYFMLKQVERGYISSDILKYGCKFIKDRISEEKKKDKKFVKYVVG
jgi:hypothetical protein